MDTEPAPIKLFCCCQSSKPGVRKCRSWRDLDWWFHGAWLFVVASLIGVFNVQNNHALALFNDHVWFVDSLFYMTGCLSWQEDCACCRRVREDNDGYSGCDDGGDGDDLD